jgi:hypothetical protein
MHFVYMVVAGDAVTDLHRLVRLTRKLTVIFSVWTCCLIESVVSLLGFDENFTTFCCSLFCSVDSLWTCTS